VMARGSNQAGTPLALQANLQVRIPHTTTRFATRKTLVTFGNDAPQPSFPNTTKPRTTKKNGKRETRKPECFKR
jgi:hypothetical protein